MFGTKRLLWTCLWKGSGVKMTFPMKLDDVEIAEMDGYSIEGYEATEKTVEDVKQFVQDENELLSLDKLVKVCELKSRLMKDDLQNRCFLL